MKETLLYLRELNHYTQNFLANYLGISRQMYAKYENGSVDPGVQSVIKLCRLYKVPYEVLMENQLKNENEKQAETENKVSYENAGDSDDGNLYAASPKQEYSSGVKMHEKIKEYPKSGFYYNRILSLIPSLSYGELLDLLSRLAHKIQCITNQTQIQRTEIEKQAGKLTDKEAEELFEYFSGRGEGLNLEYEAEKSEYLKKKYL